MRRKFLLLLCCATLTARADDGEDRQRAVWQGIERTTQQREAEALASEGITNGSVAGEDHHTDATAWALMAAINRSQWAEVERVLTLYRQTAAHEEGMVLFAEAALARSRGDGAAAEKAYRALLAQYPDFVRARLDLARLLFDDWQNAAAQEMLAAIDTAQLPPAVRHNIAAYLRAIDMRQAVHGSMTAGMVYADNLNQSARRSDCLQYNRDGSCFYRRTSPDALRAYGVNYDVALSKRWALRGHHGVLLRASGYGHFYRHHAHRDEITASLAAGYAFRNARNDFSLSPGFEYAVYGGHALYRAPSLRMQFDRTFSPRFTGNLQLEHKRPSYFSHAYRHNDGAQTAAYATLSYAPNAATVYYGGVDVVRQKAREATVSYRQAGFRVGVYRQFSAGITLNASLGLRYRRHDVNDAVLGRQRQDWEQLYHLAVGMPRLAVGGFTPLLSIRHKRVRSNVNWLYSRHGNEINIKLEKYF